MSKVETLNILIENICGFNDDNTITALCKAVSESKGGCVDIRCDECPLSSDKNFTELAVELDNIKGK